MIYRGENHVHPDTLNRFSDLKSYRICTCDRLHDFLSVGFSNPRGIFNVMFHFAIL